jgi:hypothetical protein
MFLLVNNTSNKNKNDTLQRFIIKQHGTPTSFNKSEQSQPSPISELPHLGASASERQLIAIPRSHGEHPYSAQRHQ